MSIARRGDIWLVNLEPTVGREQAGIRPCLIISADIFNSGPADLVFCIPITSTNRSILTHVEVLPPEGGLKVPSYIMTEQVRSISTMRLSVKWGQVSKRTLDSVSKCIRILLNL